MFHVFDKLGCSLVVNRLKWPLFSERASLSTGDCSYVPFFDVYFPSSINCANDFVLDVLNVPSPVSELFVVVLNRSIGQSCDEG